MAHPGSVPTDLPDTVNDGDGDYFLMPVAEFKRHMEKVNVCVGMLNAIMSALAQNPMFAGFLPADIRAQIAELSE